jgi:RND superfamily putative drug exporter
MTTEQSACCGAPDPGQVEESGPANDTTGPIRPARRRRDLITITLWLLVLVVGGASGAVVFDRLPASLDPVASSESEQGRRIVESATGEADSVVALVAAGTPPELVRALPDQLRALPGVQQVRSSAEGQLPPPGAGGTLLTVAIRAGLTDNAEDATVEELRSRFGELGQGHVILGGYPIIDLELGETAEADLIRAEAVALVLVLILLGVALRSAVGAALGLALALTTVTGALAILLAVSTFADVSSFAVNVITMFGMGLAVDYGLLVVNRFRRERGAGRAVPEAVAVTMRTAGRTVAFSGLTVAVALGGLLIFREPIMRSMAYGGVGAVGVAVAAALTLLPALLRRWGHRIPPAPAAAAHGRFAGLARAVQQRPLLIAAGTFAILAVLAVPLLGLRLEGLDARALPIDSPARQQSEQLERLLPQLARTPVTVVADTSPQDPRLAGYLAQLTTLPNVDTVVPRHGIPGRLAVVDVTVNGAPAAREAMGVVDDIRALDPPFGTHVTGLAAKDRDFITSLLDRTPIAAAVIAVSTFLVLLLVTGGLLVAVKAVLMNVASLAASLGALVWIFQHGHLSNLLGFTPTGGLELVIIVLATVFAFGLSTDYEVFLLSSVMAARHDGQHTDAAVATGIQRTGRIITTAAVLIMVVFVGFASGDLLIIKQLGVGLTIAVLLDATIVRLALTPALMTLLGERNWAGPRWASRASQRLWMHD